MAGSLATMLAVVNAVSVVGKPEGFGSQATGGVKGPTVTPQSNADLINYLKQSGPLTIVVSKTFDFRGTEGTVTETGCAPYGTGASCQLAINAGNWCKTEQPNAPSARVTYDKAGTNPLQVTSDKSVIGVGRNGVIRGKGFRMAGGTNNVILQNLEIRDLNPQYVWGGDAVTLDGTSNIWIDHVKVCFFPGQSVPVCKQDLMLIFSPQTSLIGRQHIVTGNARNTGVTISNNFIEGQTNWSPSCDSYHYWAVYMTGAQDTITFKNNYLHHLQGRSPKLGGNAVVHLVNNLWSDNIRHAIEGAAAYALLEGSVFRNVKTSIEQYTGYIWAPAADDASCQGQLGRSCVRNIYESSPAIVSNNNQPVAKVGRGAAGAQQPTSIGNLGNTAGNTL
jgi:pectin lyase